MFFSWIVLLLFIQKIPRLGIFVVMFTDVMWTFAQFFSVFIFFIFGFAFSFSILMGNQVRPVGAQCSSAGGGRDRTYGFLRIFIK